MDQNNENYQNEGEVVLEDDSEEVESMVKKKNLSTVVIIEIILFLVVLILAITFFSSRGSFNFLIFSTEVDTSENNKGQLEKNNSIVIDDIKNEPVFDLSSPDDEIISTSPGETTVVESPRLTLPVPDQSRVSVESDIPAGAIIIEGLKEGFSPSEFKVAKGEMITLALVSRIDYPYTLTFYHESMPAISIGLGPKETRWISFKAPEIAGEYEFKNDIFGKSSQRGKMIVE